MSRRNSDDQRCAMRDTCGKKTIFGQDLPCPYDGPPVEPDDESRQLLIEACGEEFASGPTCCTSDQVNALNQNFKTVDSLISSCPACRNNFRSFFCQFTCSPDQGSFLNITSTQTSTTDEIAVKSLDFFVGQNFAEGFFDSCKNVQMGALNGYAMELIGGGAKDYRAFLEFLGEEKAQLGSPFQIDFPFVTPPEDFTLLDPPPRNCSDNDLASKCSCVDCPSVCPVLAPVDDSPTCNVGVITCFSFILILAYSLAVLGFLIGLLIQTTIRRRRERRYERVALSTDTGSLSSPRTHTRGLVGAGSLAQYMDEDSLQSTMQNDARDLGRGASLLDPVETVQPRQYKLNNILRRFFYKLGLVTASSPWLTFACVFTVVGLLNIGWKKFEVETDPVRLWVPPTSESRLQKEYFDQHFGPFYRPQQVFITSASVEEEGSSVASDVGPVVSWDHLKYWSKVQTEIRELESTPNRYTLDDVCFKPGLLDDACVVQSVIAWFGGNLNDYEEDTWADHFSNCASSPGEISCLPDFQQPLPPHYLLGGVPKDDEGEPQYLDAEAMVVTYVVSDSLDPEIKARALEWEETLKNYLVELSERAPKEAGLYISFSTGVSLEEEINKSTNMDVKIVVLSYLAMFLYVSLTLGNGSYGSDEESLGSALLNWARNFPRLFSRSNNPSSSLSVDSRSTPRWFPRLPTSLFTGSKFTLGLFGISLVILSVSSSVGFFSACRVKVTLIIAEVIPFLVLAVGVDNVFILVHELDRQNLLHGPNAAAPASLPPGGGYTSNGNNSNYNTMSPTNSHRRSPFDSSGTDDIDVASMPLYLSAEERVARTLAKMGPSILLSTITETTAFALGALVPMPAVRNFALYAAGSVFLNAVLQVTVFVSAMLVDLKRQEANRVDCFPCIRLPTRIALMDAPASMSGVGKIARFIRKHYAPLLLKPAVKVAVLLVFSGIFIASVIMMQYIELGLDQRLALPSESYLVDYFNKMDEYLNVGPPVYFVMRDADVQHRPDQRALCGRFTTCEEFSVANVLEAERQRAEYSYISEPSASWIDDFFMWLNPAQDGCCRVRKRDPDVFCGARDSPRLCRPCYEDKTPAWNTTMRGFPEEEEFVKYLKQWLSSPPSEDCPVAGKASFGTALAFNEEESQVVASHFRTFHSPLKSQADLISSFAAAHRIADEISEKTGLDVFPYSLHYVFFDQYAHIVAITQEVLGLGLGSVLLVTAVLLGSWRTGTIVTAVVGLTVVTVMGVMAIWGINLNAISLVNLVISLGIAVEFCAHVARAFMSAGSGLPVDHPAGQKERDERMWTALVDVGPSVLSGITFTKLIGMCVLALTRSRLLEIYYFRMWLTLIISGALHGLVLLPVVLSIAGGPGFPMQEADEEWMTNAIRNDYEYAPFLADDDSVTSD
ncbi:multidrug efflux transporter AcrB transmembrane domain-containing protein [Dendrothele bispora CBS 962.96]|uniref:Multidrug efflux transporter AcrB transmembrane domain-containing protein n=1 Tax=Dendrothele bispora (strain CBS 962.96) TaxID=1314807 RepID=A0A4S8MR00_DENBC|nr:multidrug efflux transporter AcrB transmembrane domain-containing protein [Dendrothele bispora CBS 962.96]